MNHGCKSYSICIRYSAALNAHPKISVITVVRNGMPFVAQTIDSVLAQKYPAVEYIVIDGISSDGTIDIIKSRQAKIAHWISEKDHGIADAFNKGLDAASGDYLLFLNSDDALANDAVLANMAEQIVQNEFPSLIYGDCDVLVRASGNKMYHAAIEFSYAGLRRGNMPPHPSLFAHRSYFEKYGKFDIQFKIAMDFEWFLRGILTERIVHVPLLVTNVRAGGMSTLNKNGVVVEIVSALKKNGYIGSRWEILWVKSYFFTRSMAKAILKLLGLYNVFDYFKHK